MCYRKPGPRCSGHAKERLDRATAACGPHASPAARREVLDAQDAYDATPKGMDAIKAQIAAAGPRRGAVVAGLRGRLDAAEGRRKSQAKAHKELTGRLPVDKEAEAGPPQDGSPAVPGPRAQIIPMAGQYTPGVYADGDPERYAVQKQAEFFADFNPVDVADSLSDYAHDETNDGSPDTARLVRRAEKALRKGRKVTARTQQALLDAANAAATRRPYAREGYRQAAAYQKAVEHLRDR